MIVEGGEIQQKRDRFCQLDGRRQVLNPTIRDFLHFRSRVPNLVRDRSDRRWIRHLSQEIISMSDFPFAIAQPTIQIRSYITWQLRIFRLKPSTHQT
jgi:hypothetical protein